MEVLTIGLLIVVALALMLGMAELNVSTSYSGEVIAGSDRAVDYESAIKSLGDVPAALVSSLTTRTNATTGTLTLATGHGVTTADKIDLYWGGGKRYGVIAGTTTSTTIPISGGTGDDLPDALSSINVGKIVEQPFPITGATLQWLVLQTSTAGYIKLVEHSGTTRTFHLTQYVESGTAYGWDIDSGLTNPITGDTVTHVHISQSDATGVTAGNKATAGVSG